MTDVLQQAADLLVSARTSGRLLTSLPESLRPPDAASAYRLQLLVASALGPIGGWKVGAATPDAPPSCAPMPATGVSASPGRVPAQGCGIEAEVAFRLVSDLPPRAASYERHEIVAALGTAHAAIEWLTSRFVNPAAVDKMSLLADGLLHGGFVWGEGVADWHGIDFASESVTQDVAGVVVRRTGNPAGDMIRLVQWLADEGAVDAGGLFGGQFVTCGSWTGKTHLPFGHTARVAFGRLGEASMG